MPEDISDLLKETLASPLGDVIASVGQGVAAAQRALDEAALAKTLEIYSEGGDELLRAMRDIGYRPTFYALPETTGEVHVSLRLAGGSTAPTVPVTPRPATDALPAAASVLLATRALPATRAYVTPVDATFANRYGYNASASAKLTFKIVPVPPPAGMDEIRAVPDLIGRTVAAARDVLEALDLGARFVGAEGQAVAEPDAAAEIRSSNPPPGTVVRIDSVIELVIG